MGGMEWEQSLRALAGQQHGVVIREQVLSAGGNQELIKTRVKRGAWKRLLAEIYQLDPSADRHAYPERRVLIETLGSKYHREKKWQLTRDCARENAIELLDDYTILKFSWDQVTRQPELVVGDVAQALGIPIQKELRLLWWKRSA